MPARKSKKQTPAPASVSSSAPLIPGEFVLAETPILANQGRTTVTVTVTHTGDRPIQVGSHFHFFETNRALEFNREASFGMRLNIPSGNAVRFEPGQTQAVELVALGGKGRVYGFNDLTRGSVRSARCHLQAMDRWRQWQGDVQSP